MITYDQARHLGKAYVGALNTGEEEFAALFAPGAAVTLGGAPAGRGALRAATPPGRTSFGGVARLDPPGVVLLVRVRGERGTEEREHRAEVDREGRILRLDA